MRGFLWRRADLDVLEGLDLLEDAVFEDVDLVDLEILDGLAIPRGVHVHAHVVRAGAEGRLVLRPQRHGREREHEDDKRTRVTVDSDTGWLGKSTAVLPRSRADPGRAASGPRRGPGQ